MTRFIGCRPNPPPPRAGLIQLTIIEGCIVQVREMLPIQYVLPYSFKRGMDSPPVGRYKRHRDGVRVESQGIDL